MKKMFTFLTAVFVAFSLFGNVLLPLDAMASKRKKEKSHMMAGEASWYGGNFHGKKTASGITYDMDKQTAAHRTLPFGTVLEVVDAKTGLRTVVCITDRGPVSRKRCIDLSRSAAMELDLGTRGVTPVTMRLVGDTQGNVLSASEAFYVEVTKAHDAAKEKIGPFTNFADATVLLEILSKTHEKATIVMGAAS